MSVTETSTPGGAAASDVEVEDDGGRRRFRLTEGAGRVVLESDQAGDAATVQVHLAGQRPIDGRLGEPIPLATA